MTLFVEVAVPVPLDRTFYYRVPESFSPRIKIGSRVLIPFNRRIMTGFAVAVFKENPAAGIPLKDIQELLDDAPVFSPHFLAFTRELAAYYFTSWGEMLQASLPPALVIKSRMRVSFAPTADPAGYKKILSAGEKKLLTQLRHKSFNEQYLLRKLKRENLSVSLPKLEKLGLIIRQRELLQKGQKKTPDPKTVSAQMEMDFSLGPELKHLAESVAGKMEEQTFAPFLIRASAEKREAVYFYLMKRCLLLGRKILFLVPEIALTADIALKLKKRMGGKVALLHSRMPEKQRELEWRRIKSGAADIVIGPRSAVLTPLDNLGLIIVDEEQDDSYYQAESPSYDARKGAWLRAQRTAATLVYGALFPSVEGAFRAEQGGYSYAAEIRPSDGKVTILENPHGNEIVPAEVFTRIRSSLDRKEPVLVFCPRRGYASFLRCSRCFYVPKCRHCDIALVYHKNMGKLICHYCNSSVGFQASCPECGGRILMQRGAGSEVVQEELKKKFPEKTIVGFDSDGKKSKNRRDNILSRFLKGKIDVLIGTSLLAHQAELKKAFLVIVYSPDNLLAFSDFQAAQRVFQSISLLKRFMVQEKTAEILIQTALPGHYSVYSAAYEDYSAFYDQELSYRRILNYPPFSCMVEVVFSGGNLRTLAASARRFASLVKAPGSNVEILGPAIAPVSRIRDKNRVQIILKTPDKKKLDKVLDSALNKVRVKKSVRIYE